MSELATEPLPDLSFLSTVQDAPEDGSYLAINGDCKWGYNNSSFWPRSRIDSHAYISDVRFPELRADLREFIGTTLGENEAALDIAGGSEATALRQLLNAGMVTRALVTNFEDRQSPMVAADTRLEQITGNILSGETWRKIITWQRRIVPQGFGLILHRPAGTLQELEPLVYRRCAELLIGMLRPGGLLFAQVPGSLADVAPSEVCLPLHRRADVARVLHSSVTKWPYNHVLIQKIAGSAAGS